MDDLYTQLRSEGIKSIQEVEIAVLETSGKLSSFKKKEDIDASLPIIVSGKIDYVILKSLGKNEEWLLKELSEKGYILNEILGACIIDNKLNIVKKLNYNGK